MYIVITHLNNRKETITLMSEWVAGISARFFSEEPNAIDVTVLDGITGEVMTIWTKGKCTYSSDDSVWESVKQGQQSLLLYILHKIFSPDRYLAQRSEFKKLDTLHKNRYENLYILTKNIFPKKLDKLPTIW